MLLEINFGCKYPLDLIPRKVPISLLNMLSNSIYGKGGGYTYAQRYYNYKVSMKHKGIIQAANNRESGWYPHMTDPKLKCICMNGKLWFNFCPDCGRKLTNG